MNKEQVAVHFNLLATVLEELVLLNKPHEVYDMDESSFPLNNCPTKNC